MGADAHRSFELGAALGLGAGLALARFAVRVVGPDLGSGYFRGIVPTLAPDPIMMTLYSGTTDRLEGQNTRFADELAALGIRHRYFVVRGGHNWALWRGNAARAYLAAARNLHAGSDCADEPMMLSAYCRHSIFAGASAVRLADRVLVWLPALGVDIESGLERDHPDAVGPRLPLFAQLLDDLGVLIGHIVDLGPVGTQIV